MVQKKGLAIERYVKFGSYELLVSNVAHKMNEIFMIQNPKKPRESQKKGRDEKDGNGEGRGREGREEEQQRRKGGEGKRRRGKQGQEPEWDQSPSNIKHQTRRVQGRIQNQTGTTGRDQSQEQSQQTVTEWV